MLRVDSIDPEGMKNAATRKVLKTTASSTARATSTTVSRMTASSLGCLSSSLWYGGVSTSTSAVWSAGVGGSARSPSCPRSSLVRLNKAALPGSGASGAALLLDLRRPAGPIAQVVELGPADVAPGDQLDLGDAGRVHREGPLDADAERDLADGEGLAQAAALAAQDEALEDLDPLPAPLDHADVHLDGVAGPEVGQIVAQLRALDHVGDLHDG